MPEQKYNVEACKKEGQATRYTENLYKCHRKDWCESKLSFGGVFFCTQTLREGIAKTNPKK